VEPNAGPTAILIDELDARGFQRSAQGGFISESYWDFPFNDLCPDGYPSSKSTNAPPSTNQLAENDQGPLLRDRAFVVVVVAVDCFYLVCLAR
jgi:hypothetical protein